MPTEDQLTRLGKLAHYQLSLEQTTASLTKQLKDIEGKYRQVSEVDIPAILDETGLSEVRLSDGTKVLLKEDLRVSTTGKYRDIINAWLMKKELGDVIKDEVTAAFGNGADAIAAEAVAMLIDAGATAVDRKRYVNPQTFAALLRELLAAGEEVPLDELGAFMQRRAKLEPRS